MSLCSETETAEGTRGEGMGRLDVLTISLTRFFACSCDSLVSSDCGGDDREDNSESSGVIRFLFAPVLGNTMTGPPNLSLSGDAGRSASLKVKV